MNTSQIEELMYQISGLLLAPVLIIIAVLFFYAFFVLGVFVMQYWQRHNNAEKYIQSKAGLKEDTAVPVKGYQLFSFYQNDTSKTFTDLEIFALKRLEKQRIVTRIAPMLGLVATMIPMGPALKSLADGNIQGISENLVIAFAAVIFGLVTSSITFWTASVKKRWLAVELNDLDGFVKQEG